MVNTGTSCFWVGVGVRILIHGSCVSRDTLELSPHSDLRLSGYFARSSMISAFASARTNLDPFTNRVASGFQRRMLEADTMKLLPSTLMSADFDVLLIDIVDERFHVLARGDERITDSPAFRESRYLDGKSGAWRRIVSGGQEHFEEWTHAVDKMLHVIAMLPKKVEVVFLDTDWAVTVAGAAQHTGLLHAGRTPAESNMLYARYREYLRTCLPEGNLIQPPAQVTVSDPNQKWGLAPFHYVQEFYDYVSSRLAALTRTDGGN